MATFDATGAECLIFTFKEGLLSAVAHDLKIRVKRFEVTTEKVDEQTLNIKGVFSCNSLEVINAMKEGSEAPSALSDKDKQKITATLLDEVLEARRFAEVKISGIARAAEGGTFRFQGQIVLKGVSRPLETTIRPTGSGLGIDVWINQPDFGMKPYSAMLGTLKIKPEIRISFQTFKGES